MKKIVIGALVIALLLCACSGPASKQPASGGETGLNVLCTTYPVYLFTRQVCRDVEGVNLSVMIDQKISCVHDYALSVSDMKKLDEADILIMNGAGFEVFLKDVDISGLSQIDCSENVALLKTADGSDDPHIWLDPGRAAQMVSAIADKLAGLDAGNADAYRANADAYTAELDKLKTDLAAKLQTVGCKDLITFHDGFAYFADAFGLTVLKAIEEEAGSEASAAEISEIVSLIDENKLPAIFTEVNGSASTAEAIARETGVAVAALNMIISSDGIGDQNDPYAYAIESNVDSVLSVTK